MITLYGRENCKLCEAAKQKLDLLDVPYVFVSLEDTAECYARRFGGGSVEAMAAYQDKETLPWIWILDEAGQGAGALLSYPEAMRLLKEVGPRRKST